jgi:hypothetical protein
VASFILEIELCTLASFVLEIEMLGFEKPQSRSSISKIKEAKIQELYL